MRCSLPNPNAATNPRSRAICQICTATFAKMLAEKVQSYIELRRSLGYAFKKQAGTLQAFVRHVESGAMRESG